MRIIVIEIKNWDKYNPRSDAKSTSWFRMSNDFFNDPDFYGQPLVVRLTWIYILCVASKKMSGVVKVNTQQIADSISFTGTKFIELEVYMAIQSISHIESIEDGPIIVIQQESSNSNTIVEHEVYDRPSPSNLPLRTNERNETNVTNVLALTPPESAGVGPKKKSPKKQPLTQTTWESYRSAYMQRYGVEPIRNATVNSKIKQFVERVGVDEAPEVARFYVSHNAQRYTGSAHSVGNMLFDAEKLRTEWARGRQITASETRGIETKQQIVNAFSRHLNANGGVNAGQS